MSRFVRPDTVRLPLSEQDWLIVKGRLNAGEHDQLFDRAMLKDAQGAPILGADNKPVLDPVKTSHALMLAYLLDWSLTDEEGRVVDIRHQPPEIIAAALGDLDFDSRQEILLAITAHDTRVRAASAEEKTPFIRERIRQYLAIARRCRWRYEWVIELDPVVYALLVEQLVEEADAARRASTSRDHARETW